MKHALAWITAALLCTACSAPGIAGPASQAIEPERPFSLRPGGTAQWAGTGLQLGFDGVTADSRCPRGEQCVWAGDATVRVWWQRRGSSREVHELHMAGAPRTARVGELELELELRLVALEPSPISGRPIPAQAYVATLVLSRNITTEIDR